LIFAAVLTVHAQNCSSPPNAIVAENCLPGNPSTEWDISGAGDLTIQGFTTDISVNRGGTIFFKVNTPASAYSINIYRIGYYGGNGARKIATVQPSAILPQSQPACLSDATTGLTDCGNWAISASWAVPSTAVSGVYLARLVRADTGGASHIIFIVRDDTGGSDVLYQVSDTTWEAYNDYGGNSLYVGNPAGRAYKVSYNRPNVLRGNQYARTWFFSDEYPMVRWLESNGYNLSYATGMDTDRYGSNLRLHRVFMMSGHDEYWSANQRANVEAARAAGIHLAFFTGNEVFWKTRWENSTDGSATPYRTLVTYKESMANAVIDPDDPPTWTGSWRDPRFSPPADGGRPENALSGTIFMVNCCRTDSMVVPADDGKMRFWRNTGAATQATGSSITLNGVVIGYEWDEELDNGFRPGGLFHLSTTTVPVSQLLLDFAETYGPGIATHHMTQYRYPSGALVFAAGTVRWSWGLDANHDDGSSTPDPIAQQATVNLFADMGVQPGSLQSGLVPASASTDTVPPVSTIAPISGATVASPVTITGSATDQGGVVGGVEVSVDGGTTWHAATGRSSWSYTWTPTKSGTVTVRSRASDDSANIETPSAGTSLTVAPRTCPCSVWTASATPQNASATDTSSGELGMKFRATQAGFVTGVRFYKGPTNTGTHIGNLWTSTGTLLARATFTNETASGWQQVNFSAPVQISANTTYVVSYFAPVGGYAYNSWFFVSGVDDEPLRALANGEDGPNGVFADGSATLFPNQTFGMNNYWVDVVFSQTVNGPPEANNDSYTVTHGQTLNVSAPGVLGNDVSLSGNPLTAIKQTDPAHGTLTLNANGSFTYTPASGFGGFDSFTYKASDGLSTSSAATVTITVTDVNGCPCTIWPPSATPGTADANDTGSVELGVKFRSTIAGSIYGVRFYKGSLNTGTHVAHLWSGTGTLLATATFANEGVSGWQQVNFAAPVNIAANTTYIASYFAPAGEYADNGGYFSSAVTSGPLSALANGTDGGNGVYIYGSGNAFPNQTYNSSNYWVDVVFLSGPPGPPIANNDSYTAVHGQPLTVGAPGVLGNDVSQSGNPLTAALVTGPSNGTVTLNANGSFTYTANANFAGQDTFTYTASDGLAASNAATVTISVPDQNGCPCTIWSASTTPGTADANDNGSVELGVKFRSSVAGSITAVRFYKGPSNTGTHVAHLWSGGGTLLATATFSNESASGWQQVNLATPVNVSANTTYIASYFAPAGEYAVNQQYFANAATNGPLTALANGTDGSNGVFMYGATGSFPNQSFNSSNYWVDVVFLSGPPGPPVANNDAYTTPHAQALTVNAPGVLANDVSGSGNPLSATLSAGPSNGTVSLGANGGFTYTPNAAFSGLDSFTYTASDGISTSNIATVTITVQDVNGCPCTIWSPSTTPATADANDNGSVELGVKFRVNQAGVVTGLRFYKGSLNTGTHVAHLWSDTGTLLASATFTNETGSGWQQVNFATPVAVAANTTYIASYFAPAGEYAVNQAYFTSAVTSGPLTALADGTDGGNGVFIYGTGNSFPNQTYNSSNYWVDVMWVSGQ